MAASGDFDVTEIAGTRRGRDDDPAAAVKEAEKTLRRHAALVDAWSTVCAQLSVDECAPIPLPEEWAADTHFSVCNLVRSSSSRYILANSRFRDTGVKRFLTA